MFWLLIGLKSTQCRPESERTLMFWQHINPTNPELESYRGTALARFEPVTICFRDCFKMPRELGGGEGGGQVKNHCQLDSDLPLPLLKQE